MVGNMIRVLRARMTLLAVDEAGMSTVEYSAVSDYTRDSEGTPIGPSHVLGAALHLLQLFQVLG